MIHLCINSKCTQSEKSDVTLFNITVHHNHPAETMFLQRLNLVFSRMPLTQNFLRTTYVPLKTLLSITLLFITIDKTYAITTNENMQRNRDRLRSGK